MHVDKAILDNIEETIDARIDDKPLSGVQFGNLLSEIRRMLSHDTKMFEAAFSHYVAEVRKKNQNHGRREHLINIIDETIQWRIENKWPESDSEPLKQRSA